MNDELLTKEACQAILGVGENAMTKYLREIRHFRLGNLRTGPIRVRRSDLEAWMERRMVAPQEEQGGQEARPRNDLPAVERRPHHRPPARRKGRAPLRVAPTGAWGMGGGPAGAGRDATGAGPERDRTTSATRGGDRLRDAALTAHGLPSVRLHSLRSTAVMAVIEQTGGNLVAAKEFARHGSIQTTISKYAQTAMEARHAATEAMDRAMEEKAK